MNQIKQKKISSEIMRALGDIILFESKDSILHNISLTACEVSNDLSFCKVFYITNMDLDKDKLDHDLNDDTASYLRTKLASTIELRHTPKLVFKYDESIEYANKIESIIEDIHSKEQ